MKHVCILALFVWLMACSSEPGPPLTEQKNETATDSVPAMDSAEATPPPVDGLQVFIDSMEKENFRIDTSRLKQISAWSRIARSPKGLRNGHVYIAAPFPIPSESKHFSDPETYYFAQWDPKTGAYKNGDDYLLMTWKIDSTGIKRENKVFLAIFQYTGYFPSYCFRNEDRLYVMINRMISNAVSTQVLTEKLKNYINRKSVVYGINNSHELR